MSIINEIRLLSKDLAAKIAAGEVVERPLSIVKELVENSVDAGATQITVEIEKGGKDYIRVTDNGCGIARDQVEMAFKRHATSKIRTDEDLGAIRTLGFRGEALASIAAVSEVTLRTRRAGDETATQVVIGGGDAVKTSSVSAPIGSNFAVRNLFYNTPARRKFLKSDNVEFKHIVEEFTRVAIPRPEIGFTLTHNGRQVHVLRKAKSIKFRILDLLGRNVVGDIVDLEADTSIVKISGFAGRPESARKALGNQYFFVGGRYFRSSYLHKAVMKAYEDFVPDGLTPSYFIFLNVNPGAVDVNIHPTKTEIKFEDDNVIFQVLFACVREALGRNSFGASIDFDRDGAVEIPNLGRGFEEYRAESLSPAVEPDAGYNPFEFAPRHEASASGPKAPSYASGGLSAGRQDYGKLFRSSPEEHEIMIVQGRFIVKKSPSGLMLVHIRRAWERVLYERALKAMSRGEHVTQTALFPVQVQVGVEQRLLFDDNSALLSSLGFDIAPIGNDVIEVRGVPEGYSCEVGKVEQMTGDLALILSDCQPALEEVMRQKMAAKFAMLGAVNAEGPSTPEAAVRLLDTLFASENAEFTPGGRRIVSLMPVEDIEKRF
jgi:DNA mismatch repair protein MutL